jgi:hypothetical protein
VAEQQRQEEKQDEQLPQAEEQGQVRKRGASQVFKTPHKSGHRQPKRRKKNVESEEDLDPHGSEKGEGEEEGGGAEDEVERSTVNLKVKATPGLVM